MMNPFCINHVGGKNNRIVNWIRAGLSLLVLAAIPCRSMWGQDLLTSRLECNSKDMKRSVCSAEGPIEKIRVLNKKSKTLCVEGKNFGFSGKTVWVDKGCAAQFEITYRTDISDDPRNSRSERRGGYRRDSSNTDSASLHCASENNRRKICNVDGRIQSLKLVKQRSEARCEEGVSYGYREDFVWVDKGCAADFDVRFSTAQSRAGWGSRSGRQDKTIQFACKSYNHKLGICYVSGSILDLRLLRTRSRASCVKNDSYGFRKDVLWVNNGCEADFEVTYRPDIRSTGSDWEYTNNPVQKQDITCKSDHYREERCNVGGMISELRLRNTRSRAACTADVTYGFEADQIWVTNGCEADFEVFYFPRP